MPVHILPILIFFPSFHDTDNAKAFQCALQVTGKQFVSRKTVVLKQFRQKSKALALLSENQESAVRIIRHNPAFFIDCHTARRNHLFGRTGQKLVIHLINLQCHSAEMLVGIALSQRLDPPVFIMIVGKPLPGIVIPCVHKLFCLIQHNGGNFNSLHYNSLFPPPIFSHGAACQSSQNGRQNKYSRQY